MADAYYDSDDDVSWGPLSLREIKRLVTQNVPKEEITSRKTISCNPSFLNEVENRRSDLLKSKHLRHCEECIDSDGEESNILFDNKNEVCDIDSSVNDGCLTDDNNSDYKLPEDIKSMSLTSTGSKQSLSTFSDDNSDLIDKDDGDKAAGQDCRSENLSSLSGNTNKSCLDLSCETINTSDVDFNDTLEEITKLLNEGINYSIKENDANVESRETEQEENYLKLQNTPSLTKAALTNSCIPVRNKYINKPNFTNILSPVAAYIKSPYSNILPEFKVPDKPAKAKNISPATSITKNRFPNVKSPVGVYIKNAPRAPLYESITPKKGCRTTPSGKSGALKKLNKENVAGPDLHDVVYRPPTNTVNNEKIFRLPSNIASLVPNENYVVKHVHRTGGIKKESVGRRLLEEDLTLNSFVDESSSQDTSVYVSNRALI